MSRSGKWSLYFAAVFVAVGSLTLIAWYFSVAPSVCDVEVRQVLLSPDHKTQAELRYVDCGATTQGSMHVLLKTLSIFSQTAEVFVVEAERAPELVWESGNILRIRYAPVAGGYLRKEEQGLGVAVKYEFL